MSIAPAAQPDQDPQRWSAYVDPYEQVFEPLTIAFAAPVLDRLGPLHGLDLLDVAAGPGGTAMAAAARGASVMAIDAAPGMVARVAQRAPHVTARVMDGMALDLPDGCMDVALSAFGVVLFPDADRGVAELFRVLRPGGRAAVLTWTEPHRYEVSARLRQAVIDVTGAPPPPGPLPAQLRFIEPDALHGLLERAGFVAIEILPIQAALHARSAAALTGQLGFAPGMAAMLDALGARRAAVRERFRTTLEADQGAGHVRLEAVAHAAIAVRPASL